MFDSIGKHKIKHVAINGEKILCRERTEIKILQNWFQKWMGFLNHKKGQKWVRKMWFRKIHHKSLMRKVEFQLAAATTNVDQDKETLLKVVLIIKSQVFVQ